MFSSYYYCVSFYTNPTQNAFSGKVFVDGKVVNKAGTQIPDKAVVEIMAEIPKYVCRWWLFRTTNQQFKDFYSPFYEKRGKSQGD